MNNREKTLLGVLGSLILLIAGVSFFAYLYENKNSEYENKTYIVRSADGKISGTIKTTVTACGEIDRCVHADYDLILNEYIPMNRKGSDSKKGAYFDTNYYYVANIYNNDLDPRKNRFDSSLMPVSQAVPSDKFEIKFVKILYSRIHKPNDFLKFNHLDIYDVSSPEYLNKFGSVDRLTHLKSTDKIKSYDFTVTPE